MNKNKTIFHRTAECDLYHNRTRFKNLELSEALYKMIMVIFFAYEMVTFFKNLCCTGYILTYDFPFLDDFSSNNIGKGTKNG